MDEQTTNETTSKVPAFLSNINLKHIAIATAVVGASVLTAKYVQGRGLDLSEDLTA